MESLTLRSKINFGGNVWLFDFEAEPPLNWQAGQFIRVELPHANPDAEGTKRSFTIASAPADGRVQIATRLTPSSFKQALAALSIGGQLKVIDWPAGDFTWPPHHPVPDQPLVLAAQGIGITPFRSLLRQAQADGRPLHAHLVHANLSQPVPFADELAAIARRDRTLRLHYLGQPLTAAALAQLIPDLPRALVYLSGPKPLLTLFAPPYNLTPAQLKQDQFPNYSAAQY